MGGDRIMYPGDCGTPTVALLTIKLHQSSTISTKDARYMTIDINNFYLNTPMERFEYMRLGGGPEKANNFTHLRAAPAYSAPQMTRAGTRLSTDLELQENSDLTYIIKRVPARVFFTFLMVSVSRHFLF